MMKIWKNLIYQRTRRAKFTLIFLYIVALIYISAIAFTVKNDIVAFWAVTVVGILGWTFIFPIGIYYADKSADRPGTINLLKKLDSEKNKN